MKASVFIAASLDGYIARKDGSLDWLPGADGNAAENEDYGYAKFFDSIDLLVMGRNTYDFIKNAAPEWPYKKKRVVVLSRTLAPDNLPEGVSLASGTAQELWEQFQKVYKASHIYLDGANTIQEFLEAGLVNEMIITRVPVLIGKGIALFGALSKDIPLQHIETKSYPSGFVQSRYEMAS